MRRLNASMLWATCAALAFVVASTMVVLDLTASTRSAFYDQATGDVELFWTFAVFAAWFSSSFAGSSALVFTVARLMGLGTERRQRPERRKLAVEVELEGAPAPATGLTQDISEGGLFVVTNHARPVGERMKLQFQLPGQSQPLSVETEVRWIRGNPTVQSDTDADAVGAHAVGGMGLRFVDLSPEAAATIQRFLKNRLP
jgi:uncharacterized protein (TIGR02266 family)